jgi:CRISPR-associated protein Cmr2
MTWDYFVFLVDNTNQQETLARPEGLSGGFVDEVSLRFFQGDKENARRRYMKHASGEITLPDRVFLANFSFLPSSNWLTFQVDFELLTPWYSKDDRLFHLLDNPVRKDRVFGVPFMAASSWKGTLRWACRMQAGLRKHFESGKRFEDWTDPDWILHLFGNEKGEQENFHQGALAFYPTWFDKIGFEVINPHDRRRRAGTQPIYYEVVPPGAKGTLSLLYAPWPGMEPSVEIKEAIPKLLEAVEILLTTYGISAKRTVGWGTAKILQWHGFHKTHGSTDQDNREALWQEVQSWLSEGGTS